jgi:hypothetical protein
VRDPFHILDGAGDTIHRTLNVALSLGLLGLDIALGLTLLARRLPRLEAGHVADPLLQLSYSVLDAARRLAINERNVSVGEDIGGGGGDGRTLDRKTLLIEGFIGMRCDCGEW